MNAIEGNIAKKCRIVAVLAMTVILLWALYGCLHFKTPKEYVTSYRRVFTNNWDVELPESMNVLFHKADDSFWGDGIRYAVFKITDETNFFEEFETETDEEFENGLEKRIDRAQFKVPKRYMPDKEAEYRWKLMDRSFTPEEWDGVSNGQCHMMYFPTTNLFIICQYFS